MTQRNVDRISSDTRPWYKLRWRAVLTLVLLVLVVLTALMGRAHAAPSTLAELAALRRPAAAAATIDLHPKLAYMARSADFAVKINGMAADVISDVDGYHYVHFSMGPGTATIEVTALGLTSISSYTISPYKNNYVGTVSANRLTYTYSYDTESIVWVSGKPKLIIVADPLYTAPLSSGTGIYNIVSYGADASGNAWSTTAIQNAINAASAWTGGRGIVYVPAGRYKVGNLTLTSDMELFLAESSAFWFSGVAADYAVHWTTKGNGTRWIQTANGASGIKIWGRGTLDGNDHSGIGIGNNILVLNNASNVEVDGIVIRKASKWGTLVGRSNNVTFNNVKFFQRMNGGENDGIDIIESQFVTVKYSIAAGWDDNYSVKTYDYDEDYIRFYGTPEEAANITFDNLGGWTGCFVFKLGQGFGQTQRDIVFKNSWVLDASHAIGIYHDTGLAVAQNITFQNIDVQKISQSVLGSSWAYFKINLKGSGAGPISNVTVKDMRIRDTGGDPSIVQGYSSTAKISGINFQNLYVDALGRHAQNAAEAKLAPNAYVGSMWVHQLGLRNFWHSSSVGMEGLADWSVGNYKGNCGPGWAMTGLSQDDVSPLPGAHAVRCKNYGAQFNDDWSSPVVMTISYNATNQRAQHFGDWDPGFAKTECALNEYVSGLSQDPGGHSLRHLRCASATMSNTSCETRLVTQDDRGEQTGDWDSGYYKAECSNDKVVVGISVTAAGKPRKLLCCGR
jgi:hypothetical protein